MFGLKRRNRQAAEQAAEAAALRRRLAERLDVELGRRASRVAEHRDSVRRTVWRVGSAAFAPDHQASCRVVDQSYSGLRLELDAAEACPDEFALTIPTLRFIGIVKTAWRNGGQVGVSIVRWSDAA